MPTAATRSKSYYGWYITLTLAVTETISWGIVYYAFSVFITPMEHELGWSRGELTGAFSLALLMMGGMAFPVGYWIDRHGARGLMTIGSIAASLLVLAWSQVTTLPALYLIWAGLGVCAATILYEPAFAVVAQWFLKRRGRALAIITFAAGLASTIFVPLSDALLRGFGWRNAVVILGLYLAVTTIPLHALMLRRRPHDMGLLPDGDTPLIATPAAKNHDSTLRNALRGTAFWQLTASFAIAAIAAAAIRVHFIPFLVDAGVESSVAAFASGAIGLMQVAGRLVFAPLETRYSSRTMVIGVFALEAVGMTLLLFTASWWAIGLFIVIFGMAYGAKTLARPAMLAELYGASHYGRISSVNAMFLTIANTAAPVGAGLLFDHFGSYQPVVWLILALSVTSVAVMLLMKPAHLPSLSTSENLAGAD